MRYIHEEERRKVNPSAYMHLYEKRWLNPNHIKHNIQCIKGDVKLLLHTCTTNQREVNHFNMKYTQHESIYREDVKLPLHISNKYQNIMIPNYDTNRNYTKFLKYQKIPIENIL